MAHWYNFVVAQLDAHPLRNERLNIGIVVFNASMIDVRPARNLDKIRAISSALDVDSVRAALLSLERFKPEDAGVESSVLRSALRSCSPFELSELGEFEAHSSASYEQAISRILTQLVEPEPAPIRKALRRSRLLTSVKNALKQKRILARKGEDLSAHRVVPGWQLAEGLSADLVLKNGAMHVIETVDAASDEVSIRKLVSDIAVSALVLEQARMTFGEGTTKSRLVYQASVTNEVVAKPSLLAAEHQGAELINWASEADRASLIKEITSLAVPIESKKSKDNSEINASTQHKFRLN